MGILHVQPQKLQLSLKVVPNFYGCNLKNRAANGKGDKFLIVISTGSLRAWQQGWRISPLKLELSTFGHKAWSRALQGTRFSGIANIIFGRTPTQHLNCRRPHFCDRPKVLNMSSPVAEPAVPAPEVKEEDSIIADSSAPDAPDNGPAPATSPEAGLTKKEFDMMSGVLHRISNYRDEEYGLC